MEKPPALSPRPVPRLVPRLPPLPQLDWKEDGTPVARAMGDVYFSVEDGLAEARAVFLAGCGLPERWAGRAQFTVAELGFGTGLNLLALWQLWKAHRPSPNAQLDFVSFEGFLLDRAAAERALGRWPELTPLTRILLERWPTRARGVQRIPLGDGVSLVLHIDEIEPALAGSVFQADAWFLDGFAPAKNEGMWAPELYPLLMTRSAPGALVGTYTVAGAVRRGLAEAGFAVSKQPGFGKKRERLQAIAPSKPNGMADPYGLVQGGAPKRVAIIGAGIGGACIAEAFQRRSAEVTVFDQAGELASGASGNRLALLMPRLDAADSGPGRVLLGAYLAALEAYRGRAGVHAVDVVQRPRGAGDEVRFQKLMRDPPLAEGRLSASAEGGLLHYGAQVLEPGVLVRSLIDGAQCVLGAPPKISLADREVNGEPFDAIVLTNGMGLAGFAQTAWLPLEGRLGQVETGMGPDAPSQAVARGHYALGLGRVRLWGATFEPAMEEGDAQVSDAARATNMMALETLVEEGWLEAGAARSRAGIRATTPDRLPIGGVLPDYTAAISRFDAVRHGAQPKGELPVIEGIYLLGGLGARGFTFAPWLADLIAASAYGAALPAGRREAELVSPARFILRGLKRGQLPDGIASDAV